MYGLHSRRGKSPTQGRGRGRSSFSTHTSAMDIVSPFFQAPHMPSALGTIPYSI